MCSCAARLERIVLQRQDAISIAWQLQLHNDMSACRVNRYPLRCAGSFQLRRQFAGRGLRSARSNGSKVYARWLENR